MARRDVHLDGRSKLKVWHQNNQRRWHFPHSCERQLGGLFWTTTPIRTRFVCKAFEGLTFFFFFVNDGRARPIPLARLDQYFAKYGKRVHHHQWHRPESNWGQRATDGRVFGGVVSSCPLLSVSSLVAAASPPHPREGGSTAVALNITAAPLVSSAAFHHAFAPRQNSNTYTVVNNNNK